jgi:hypothetical protein
LEMAKTSLETGPDGSKKVSSGMHVESASGTRDGL